MGKVNAHWLETKENIEADYSAGRIDLREFDYRMRELGYTHREIMDIADDIDNAGVE